MDTAIENRDPDQWITIGNVNEGEFGFDVIEVASRSQPHEWIDLINMLICEGLHAPLLLYLKNATEASATVMMESVDRLVNGKQRYIKRRVEKYLFEPQVSQPVPRLIWGAPKTGLEKVTLTELASIINSPKLANNQAQELIKMFFPNLPEPEWEKGPQPQLFQPFGSKPFQKQPQEMPVEALAERINDLGTGLNIIEASFREKRLSFIEAIRQGSRTIDAHLKRIHGENTEAYASDREVKYKEWVKRIMPATEGKTYEVRVS